MVLLNCLPPFPTNMPSAGLSILKSYLEHYKIPTKVVYWNLELSFSLEKRFALPETALFPLLIVLLHQLVTKTEVSDKVKAYLTATEPSFFTSNEKIKRAAEFINDYFREELSVYKGCKLFGFSAKHDQWFSSLPCSALVKEIFPEAYVVVGGFQRKSAAEYYLDINPSADFTCWGEGEAALKSLWEYCLGGSMDDEGRSNQRGEAEKEKTEDSYLPPGVVKRAGNTSIAGNGKRENVSDFRETLFPDYEDFTETIRAGKGGIKERENEKVVFPVDGIRGCTWNRCRFCVATEGFRYSERSPESIAKEMVYQYERHGIRRFYFADDDTGGGCRERLERLASAVSSSGIPDIECTAWINPAGLDLEIFEMLKRSGFSCLKTGNEADSDNLLRKMDKKSRFADNILFIKASARFGIKHQGGIPLITGVPNETENDITESIRNLRFLRFYLGENTFHSFNSFDLSRGSRYYRSLDDEEKSYYTVSMLGEMLPRRLLNEEAVFEFLQFKRSILRHTFLWQQFRRAHDRYVATEYRYELNPKKSNRYDYREYADDMEIGRMEIDPISVEILRYADGGVVSLAELKRSMAETGQAELTQHEPRKTVFGQDEEQLIAAIQKLKQAYILYASEDYSHIISLLDARRFPSFVDNSRHG